MDMPKSFSINYQHTESNNTMKEWNKIKLGRFPPKNTIVIYHRKINQWNDYGKDKGENYKILSTDAERHRLGKVNMGKAACFALDGKGVLYCRRWGMYMFHRYL